MFMKPSVYFGQYFSVETSNGTDIVPADVACWPLEQGQTISEGDENFGDACEAFSDFVQGEVYEISFAEGWLARMSAPGYMDCTEWDAYQSESEAWESLIDMYCEGDLHCEWLPASWEGEFSFELLAWANNNHPELILDGAFTVGESKAVQFANGTQDARLFVFKVKN